ncbi:MAG: hypothetical protein IJY66_00270 [Clostridia bacterium]|nr:hypothetical protein [Clostridia bacterium]
MDIFNNIDMSRFYDSLTYMWQGMLCIFIVIGVLIVTVSLLGRIPSKKD